MWTVCLWHDEGTEQESELEGGRGMEGGRGADWAAQTQETGMDVCQSQET